MLTRKPLPRWVGLILLVGLVLYFHPTLTGTRIRIVAESAQSIPLSQLREDDFTWVKQVLRKNGIGSEITYASRTIQYVPDAPYRKSITEVDDDLLPNEFSEIDIKKRISVPVGRLVQLHVHQSPRPDQVDASSLIFGASTTFERFTSEKTNPVSEWKRWLTDGHGHTNGAGLVLALFNTSDAEIAHVNNELVGVGINDTVIASDMRLDMAGRYVALVSMLYNHSTRDARKYFALIDDDTFFPCISALMDKLSRYEPTKPYYIGTFTERVDWMIDTGAPMAYGGGGIFLTAPVARKLTGLPCLEKDEVGNYVLKADQGDHLLYNCIRNYTEIRLSYMPALRQLDQAGDSSGFYESGEQPLSIHHYKSWHELHPDKVHVVADACGEDCIMQRFQFKDDFILSNGYSVAHYPRGIDFDPLIMEGTFENGDGDLKDVTLSYTFGAFRPSLAHTGRKLAWELLDATREGDGRVRQIYLKRRGDGRWVAEGEEHPERDSIVVLVWTP